VLFASLICGSGTLVAAVSIELHFLRLPEGSMQPQLVADRSGSVHAVWLSGSPSASDVQYARLNPDGSSLASAPIRVNSQPGSAIGIGTIRGPQLAFDAAGTAHVVWNGSGTAQPRPAKSSPLLYTRRPAGADGFEAQRNLIQSTTDLDGGGSIAVDSQSRVHVFWHAGDGKETTREDRRRVFAVTSTDGGKHFESERPIDAGDGTGVCGCCGLRAGTDSKGRVFVAYRGARELMHRGTYVLESDASGTRFQGRLLQDWVTGSCPMSLPALFDGTSGMNLAWETEGKIFGRIGSKAPTDAPQRLVDGPRARHPSAATNPRGETLLVWTEDTGWNRGGKLGWCVFAADGRPTDQAGVREGLPVWTFPGVAALSDGSFVIAY